MRRLLLTVGLLLSAAPAAGQTLADYDYEHLAFRGVGLDFGRLWADKILDTEVYSLRLDLGYLGPGVRIIPSISYWSSQFTLDQLNTLAARIREVSGATTPQGDDLSPIRWSDISLSVDGQFVWNTPLHVLTFLGAGLGLHALNGQGEAIQDTFVEDLLDSIAAAVSVMGGFEFEPIHRFRVYAEGRYTAMNAIQYLSARGGLQFMFTQGAGIRVGAAVPAPPITAEAP